VSRVLERPVDRAGRMSASATDNTAITSYTYDSANRQLAMADPLGNVVASTRIDKCTITGVMTTESFSSQIR